MPFVDSTGLSIPSVEDILADLTADQRAAIDPLLNTDPDSPLGQINGPFSSHLREAWEVLQLAFNGLNPDAAEGALLEHVSAITGTIRSAATKSKFIGTRRLDLNLDAATTVPIGTIFQVDGDPQTRFLTTEEIVSVAAGNYKVNAEAENTGAIICNANTLTVIVTSVVGLNSVNNAADAILGKNVDTDSELRRRRETELRATGAANPDSIRADLLDIEIEGVNPVLACSVLFNDKDVINLVTGLPPHSIECVIYDGVVPTVPNDTIAQIIWDSSSAGDTKIGTSQGTAVDDFGGSHTIKFTRATIVPIGFVFDLTTDSTYVGDANFKQAILDDFNARITKAGQTVVVAEYIATAMRVQGVTNAQSVQTGPASGVLSPYTDYTLAIRSIGTLQTPDILVL